jgi:hypothetical protein
MGILHRDIKPENFMFLAAPVYNPCLVGGLEQFLFFHILGMSSSQQAKSYFSEG